MQNIGLFCVTTPGVNQSEKLGSVKHRDQCLSVNNHSSCLPVSFYADIFEKCLFDVLIKMSTLLKRLYVCFSVCSLLLGGACVEAVVLQQGVHGSKGCTGLVLPE